MLRLKLILLVVSFAGGMSMFSLPIQVSAASFICSSATAGQSCSNPLYVCRGNSSSSGSTSYSCVCRWGDFESIDLGLIPGLPRGITNICDVVSRTSSAGTADKRSGMIYILNYFIVMITALVIMAALVSIVIGGYIYMTAGGSADRVRVAKTWIVSAILGIIIALSAWMILWTINPYLLGG